MATDLVGPGSWWTEREMERICMVCLRREWLAAARKPVPRRQTEIERLRGRLR